MARPTLDLPAEFVFHTELTVRIGDINYGQHLGNDSLLTLLQEARLRFLAGHGFSEVDAGGVGLIMTDVLVLFKSQAFYGDHLRISIQPASPEKCTFGLVYAVENVQAGREVARARTGMAFFDYAKKRIARMPEAFAQKVF